MACVASGKDVQMLSKRKWLAASVAAALGAAGATAVYTQWTASAGMGASGLPGAKTGQTPAALPPGGSTMETVPQTYIVIMEEAPLATYKGGVAGLPAPERLDTGHGERIDVHGDSAKLYVSHLRRVQSLRAADLGRSVGRPLKVRHAMQHALNAVVTELTPAEAARLARAPGVSMVEPYREYPLASDVGPAIVGAEPVWGGTVHGEPRRFQGEGVVVGIIDTGINFGSPSFAAVDPVDGYRHINELGSGNYLGTCAPGGVDQGRCNDKLIGGYDFVCSIPTTATLTICTQTGLYREEPGFGDTNSHGSHVASTAAGNRRNVTFRGTPLRISGVAPRANIVAYDTCYTDLTTGGGSCPNVATVAAVNQAVADGVVDVLNYSIGGGTSPWGDAISQAFLNAVDAGIYVAAAAGNSGPGEGTTGHHQPWVGTTAAAQHGRGEFVYLMDVTEPAPVPVSLQGMVLSEGSGSPALSATLPAGTPLRVSPGINTANDGCASFAGGTFAGSIALVRRGTCAFTVKVANAVAAGAVTVVIANNQAGAISPSAPGAAVPVFGLAQATADALRTFAAGHGGTVGARIPMGASPQTNTPHQLAAFSSRGPGLGGATLKPDLTAPGVSILAAIAGTTLAPGSENAIGLMNGTSMASPHHAGTAALLRQARPGWTPSEIKSALMMTAVRDVLMENGTDPAGPFARGAGRIRVDQAIRAGLVMDETKARYLAANPAIGGDPSALNLPTLMNDWCYRQCTFTRTFRSTQPVSQTWSVRIDGLRASASPSSFTIRPGQSVTVRFTVESLALSADGRFHLGEAILVPQANAFALAPLRMPMAIAVQPASASVPSQVEGTARVGEQTSVVIPVVNAGGARLRYTAENTGTASLEILNTPASTTTGFRSTRYTDSANPPGQYAADDFEVRSPVQLTSLVARGFMVSATPLASAAQDITWSIYADAGGVPGGNPETAPSAAIWSYTAVPSAPGVSTANSVISLDLAAAGRNLVLQPGRYWLVVNARSTFANRWVWYASASAGAGSIPGLATITPNAGGWATNASFPGLAWRVAGEVTCGAPWIGAAIPRMGDLEPGAAAQLSVPLSASRLSPGRHEAYTCISTSDPLRPKLAVRVVLNVTP